jgi:stage II sporulation protein D
MKKVVIFFLAFLYVTVVNAQTMQISIHDNVGMNTLTVSIREGKYYLECDGEKYGEYKKNNIFLVSRKKDKIEIRDKSNLVGIFNEVSIKPDKKVGILTLKGVLPSIGSNEYDDALIFRITDNRLKVINFIDLEKYIAGVIEAEGGINAPYEYYKAQAVLIRTYTIKNIYKHAEEGFNLCDQVHCQAYHGRNARNENIYKATVATSGEVLIDEDSVLIMSPFHSNCGGETSSAGIYWQSDLPYLQSVKDPFCTEQRNAHWEKSISKNEWFAFLKNNGIRNPERYLNFQDSGRQKYFIENKITLRQIRERFGLKSTLFSVSPSENEIIFRGRGYGHGIGMCQLGAMEMAKVGYTYLDIIHFYFQHVDITDYREMELHRY